MEVSKRLARIRLINLAEKHRSFANEIGIHAKLVAFTQTQGGDSPKCQDIGQMERIENVYQS